MRLKTVCVLAILSVDFIKRKRVDAVDPGQNGVLVVKYEGKIVYFENPGTENTEETLRISKRRAEELGIKTIIVASTIGNTAVRATEVFEGMKVIAVSHVAGFRGPNMQEFTEENRKLVESRGGVIVTSAHAFGGIDRAMRKRYNMALLGETIASTLRIFGQGMKVVVECALMAADAGLVRVDENVISIAGTGRGADTAVVIRPVYTTDFFNVKVQEILCKPHFAKLDEK